MAAHAPVGPKIREKRKTLGMTQAALAKRLSISPSYLNLIEANKRPVGIALLRRFARELAVGLESLEGAAEGRLIEDLKEMAADPLFRSVELDGPSASEFVARHPKWAKAATLLYRAYQDQSHAVAALADRLTQDPFVGDAVHRILTNIAAIRSAAEILESVDDLTTAQRQRFHQIMSVESERLSDIANRLAAFFSQSATKTRPLTASEEVDDFLLERNNFFPALEEAAVQLKDRLFKGCALRSAALIEALVKAAGIKVLSSLPPETEPLEGFRNGCRFDEATRSFFVMEGLRSSTRRFQLARLLARLELAGLIDQEVERCALLTTKAARVLARRALASYAAGALLMPYSAFLADAVDLRYDVDLLAQKHDVSFEQACHRLVTLRDPGQAGIPFAFMRADPAGFVTKRFPLPRFSIPRYGHACPLWAVYTAYQTPGVPVRQLALFPNGESFLLIARTTVKNAGPFGQPRHMTSVMLGCEAVYADRTVYGRGLDAVAPGMATRVGPTCRLCPRIDCAHRAEEPILI